MYNLNNHRENNQTRTNSHLYQACTFSLYPLLINGNFVRPDLVQTVFKIYNQTQAFSLDFSTKTYVVGTQKKCLNETVLFNTQNIC